MSTFHLRLCLQVSQAVPPLLPPPTVSPTPRFVSTLSYTSPVTWHRTSWLLSPQPVSFDSIPTRSCWGGTLNAFKVALAPCSSPRDRPMWEQRIPAPPRMIDSRDALSSHPPRPRPSPADSIAFHKFICVAPSGCTSNAGTTPVSFRMTPWGHKACVCDLPLAGLQPHLHKTLLQPHCIVTVSMLNPSETWTKHKNDTLHLKDLFFLHQNVKHLLEFCHYGDMVPLSVLCQ